MRAAGGGTVLDLYVTANSPGEISGWVAPLARELRTRIGSLRMTVIVPPCQYASGGELELGRQAGADRCVRVGDLKHLIDARNDGESEAGRRLAMHLGGDAAFSVYISRRLKCPLWVYSSRPRWRFFVDRYFLPDERAGERFASRGVTSSKYSVIGNIALDSAVLSETEEETREFMGIGPDDPVLACLVGSRPLEYTEATRLFVAASRAVTDRFPEIKVVFPLAPTVDEDILRGALSGAGIGWTGESRVRELDLGNGRTAAVTRGRTLETLNCSKLALTVPGTNNLQAAALYIPFIMVLPLDRADEFPLDGLPGLLPLWLPGVRRLKRSCIERMNEKTGCVSLPNKLAGRMIAPEIRGYFDHSVVARMAIGLLESPESLKEISRAFWELTRERGAAARLATEMEKFAAGKE
jgi:lipid-A-disaccharide synthase